MKTRTRLLLVAAALATTVAACSADAVIEETQTDDVAAGLRAWREATVQQAIVDREARTAQGLAAWRKATAERARIDRLAEIEQLRAEAKVAADRLRIAQAEEAVEHLRAQAKVNGDTLRLAAVTELADKQAIGAARAAQVVARFAEIEQLRAEAKVAGDQLRQDDDTVTVWTEVGPVTVDKADRADHVAALGGNDAVETKQQTCDEPRVVAFTFDLIAAEAGQCPASNGLWVPPPPRIVISSISIEQAERIPWALDLFDRAGLRLPEVEFQGQPTTEPCSGRAAMAKHGDRRTVIDVCMDESGPQWDWVLLHELGHAWSTYRADPERLELFTSVRGLASWREGAWHERASEHASEVLVWGLMDRPVKPGHITNNSCMELLVGYRALTGLEPLHGFQQRCD